MKTESQIQDALRQPLDVTRVKKRAGAGSKQLSYIEAHDAIDTANRIFGFDGWSHVLHSYEHHRTGESGMFFARVEVRARLGEREVAHGDIGVGLYKKGAQEEIEKAIKEAVSDGLKRALRAFGDQFGNCLYDKLAPEHHGETRPALATAQPRAAFQALREEALSLGVKRKDDLPLWQPDENTTANELAAQHSLFQTAIAKRREKQTVATSPDPPLYATLGAVALSGEYARFVAACGARHLRWESDMDLQEFEQAMGAKLGLLYVALEATAADWAENATLVESGELTWEAK